VTTKSSINYQYIPEETEARLKQYAMKKEANLRKIKE
jgi:hypothetical protein